MSHDSDACNALLLLWLQHGASEIQIILVGHKSDKEDNRSVEKREGEAVKAINIVT